MKPEVCSCGELIYVAKSIFKKKVKLNRTPRPSGTWFFDVGLNRVIQVPIGTYSVAYEDHKPFCLKARK